MFRRQTSIRRMFTAVLFGITTVGLLIILVIINISVIQSQWQERSQSVEKRLDGIRNTINYELDSVLDVSNNIIHNELITSIFEKEPGESMKSIMEDYDFLHKHFGAYNRYGANTSRSIYIYPVDNRFPVSKYVYKIEKLQSQIIWEEVKKIKSYEAVWDYTEIEQIPYISLIRKMHSKTGAFVGYLEIRIHFNWFSNVLTETEFDYGERIVYEDADGRVIYTSTDKTVGDTINFETELINKDCIRFSVEKAVIIRANIVFVVSSAAVFVILLLIMWFLSKYFVFKITDELHGFINELNREEGSLLDVKLTEEDKRDSELYEIKKKFIMLIEKVSDMHNSIEKMECEKRKLEMEYLQMSFNPHLLYNSLSTLNWILRKTDRADMVELVDCMTEYYRAVLSGGNNIITIGEELELIKQYIAIVRISYNRTIEFKVECDEEVLNCFIIKQLLQPIVENAVLHGAKGTKCTCVFVKICKDEKDLVFTVINNGIPISEDEIEMALTAERKKPGRRSYGLKNTVNRIRTYYGEQYGLTVKGIEGIGTEVNIRIECLSNDSLKERM